MHSRFLQKHKEAYRLKCLRYSHVSILLLSICFAFLVVFVTSFKLCLLFLFPVVYASLLFMLFMATYGYPCKGCRSSDELDVWLNIH